jgi:hypothetical protein
MDWVDENFMEKKSVSKHSLEDLKHYHKEAMQFFGAELMLLKEMVPKITNERLSKAAVLLITCGQTGAALFKLSTQVDTHTREVAMLARSFMETITNFCYVGVCDEKEYRAFILHPIYKYYHAVGTPNMEDYLHIDEFMESALEFDAKRKKKQQELKTIPVVQEALAMFSETKKHLNWTKTRLDQKIQILQKWGKFMDVFFTLNKIRYYSDSSEALHGSLYGCTYGIGTFDPEFDSASDEELNKKLYKENACVLLHLGMLIHESFTLVSYSDDIDELWHYSYKNRNQALNLLWHLLGKNMK